MSRYAERLVEFQYGVTEKGSISMEDYGMGFLQAVVVVFFFNRLISKSEVEYCTFHKGSKILHSVRWYQYCGMAKQPKEGGVWDGGVTGVSLGGVEGAGMVFFFRHKPRGSCCYQMVYPPLDPPMKKLFLRCVMTTLAPCMAASWAALGGCPGGGGWWGGKRKWVMRDGLKTCRRRRSTHWDGNATASWEASTSIEATFHHYCWSRGVHCSHGIVSHRDILAHRSNLHVRLHGHIHLSARVRRRHLRHLTRHLRWKHIPGLVYLQERQHVFNKVTTGFQWWNV